MFGQNGIHNCVVAIDKIEYRAISLHEVNKETQRLFVHRLSKFVCKAFETPAVDAVVLLEPAKVQPVTAKFRSHTPDALVPQHASCLSKKNLTPVQVSGRGMAQQLVIRQAGPKKVAQPTGQIVVRQRTGNPAGLGKIGAITEPG